MNWYKKCEILELDPVKIAKKLGIIYNGEQYLDGKIVGHFYTDPQNGSTFFVKLNQDTEKKLIEHRKKFKL